MDDYHFFELLLIGIGVFVVFGRVLRAFFKFLNKVMNSCLWLVIIIMAGLMAAMVL